MIKLALLPLVFSLTLSFSTPFVLGQDQGRLEGENEVGIISRIAFGSCANQRKPQPIWDAINELNPQLFIFTGDNVYADTGDPEKLKRAYDGLGAVSGFARLRGMCPILATWDDHDYGKNDAGAEFEGKHAAKQAFMNFFATPVDSPVREREGIHDSRIFGPEGQRVQVILLDTRWFRGPLTRMDKEERSRLKKETGRIIGPYLNDEDSDSTILGSQQWEWLIEQLQKPAELRLIVTSIQVITMDHEWEKWGNLPKERRRLLEAIGKYASNVIILSGDRHSADISMLPPGTDGGPLYPLYDITSSGLTESGLKDEPNRFRVSGDDVYNHQNFGWISIDWDSPDPKINLEIRNLRGKIVREVKTTLGTLEPK
jgi:alkaline phosphatase D